MGGGAINYRLLKLNDGTDIVYSDIKMVNHKETIYVTAERWNDQHDDFDSLYITLPDFILSNDKGFSNTEKEFIISKIRRFEKLIFEFSREDRKISDSAQSFV